MLGRYNISNFCPIDVGHNTSNMKVRAVHLPLTSRYVTRKTRAQNIVVAVVSVPASSASTKHKTRFREIWILQQPR